MFPKKILIKKPIASVYWGEQSCQGCYKSGPNKGKPCANKAYWNSSGKYFCAQHSDKKNRTELTKNPNAKNIKDQLINTQQLLVEQAKEQNAKAKHSGQVICSQLKMLKPIPHQDGFLKIFPNYKHGNRKDGFGCPSLSPKSLGPIRHGMPNVSDALSLENFHQFSKCFEIETDPLDSNIPLPVFYQNRETGFKDPTPHRHKFDKGLPLYSVFSDISGKEYHYSYVECRYFYCHFYEKLAIVQSDFKQLMSWIKDGYNLQIIGYDAYPISKSLYEHYVDTSKSFGHELVLYCLLTITDPKDYPWNIYREKNPQLYDLGWL